VAERHAYPQCSSHVPNVSPFLRSFTAFPRTIEVVTFKPFEGTLLLFPTCLFLKMVAASSKFRGDGEDLVDALIAACEMKSQASSNYTGFGRELVPYFSDFECEILPKVTKVSQKPAEKKKPKKSSRTQYPASSGSSSASSSSSSSGSSSSGGSVDLNFRSITCPFVTPPKPDMLPAPSSSLFHCAFPVQRSPSMIACI
jgi:uncharacterized membrane protein YgcG